MSTPVTDEITTLRDLLAFIDSDITVRETASPPPHAWECNDADGEIVGSGPSERDAMVDAIKRWCRLTEERADDAEARSRKFVRAFDRLRGEP